MMPGRIARLKELVTPSDTPNMERRRELRLKCEQELRVTVLGTNGPQLSGRAVDLSGRGIRVFIPAPISPGSAVKIELEDALLLGEVCYCHPAEPGFVAGVEVDQALNGLTQLAVLNDALMGDSASRRVREPELVRARR